VTQLCDGGPSGRTHIRSLTMIMIKRLEEEGGAKKTLLL